MKVVMVTDVFPNNVVPTHGTFSLERLKCFKQLAEVKVVAAVPYFPRSSFLKIFNRWHDYTRVKRFDRIEGVDVYHPRRVVIPKIGSFTNGIFYRKALIKELKKIHKEFPFDIIDAHFAWPDGFAAIGAGRALNVPVCITVHGTDVNLMPKFRLIRPYIEDTLKKADRIIAVSQALADITADLGASQSKVKVIHNGVDISKFKKIDKSRARDYLRLGYDQKILLSIGALIPRKGHEFLIKAVSQLVHGEGHDKLKLLIIGQGEHRGFLQAKIKECRVEDQVKLIGPIPHRELYRWLSAADFFCLASSREGWPTVFFESWACGCPVLATSVHGAPEAICSNQYGLLIQNQDSVEIAETIKKALTMEWDADEMIAYAARNTWENMVKQMYKELESVLNIKEPVTPAPEPVCV